MAKRRIVVKRGFAYVEGVKICRVNRARGTLEFPSKNRFPGEPSGIEVTLDELAAALSPDSGEPPSDPS